MEFVMKKVPEKSFVERVQADITKFAPEADEVAVVMLASKLGSFDSPTYPPEDGSGFSPVFVYGKDDIEAAEKIMSVWIDRIASKHYMLPALTVDYFLARMAKKEFEDLFSDPSRAPDKNLAVALQKAKAESVAA